MLPNRPATLSSTLRRTGPNRIEGDDGFVVEVLGRTQARVGMHAKTFRVSIEAMGELTTRPTMSFYLNNEVLDEGSGRSRLLTVAERRSLGSQIERAFEFVGWVADVRYGDTWVKRNEELYSLLEDLRSRIAGVQEPFQHAIDLALQTTSTVTSSFLESARIALEELKTSPALVAAERLQVTNALADLAAGRYVSIEPLVGSTQPSLEYALAKKSREEGPRSEVEVRWMNGFSGTPDFFRTLARTGSEASPLFTVYLRVLSRKADMAMVRVFGTTDRARRVLPRRGETLWIYAEARLIGMGCAVGFSES